MIYAYKKIVLGLVPGFLGAGRVGGVLFSWSFMHSMRIILNLCRPVFIEFTRIPSIVVLTGVISRVVSKHSLRFFIKLRQNLENLARPGTFVIWLPMSFSRIPYFRHTTGYNNSMQ